MPSKDMSNQHGELHCNGSDIALHEELGSFNNEPKAKRIGKPPESSTVEVAPEDDDSISIPLNPDAFASMHGGIKHIPNEAGGAEYEDA